MVALRDSGLEVAGVVAWGSHFCQFYETRQNLLDILVPYLRAGLGNHEQCTRITGQPLLTGEVERALTVETPDLRGAHVAHWSQEGEATL